MKQFLFMEGASTKVIDLDLEIEYVDTDQCDITDDAATVPDYGNVNTLTSIDAKLLMTIHRSQLMTMANTLTSMHAILLMTLHRY